MTRTQGLTTLLLALFVLGSASVATAQNKSSKKKDLYDDFGRAGISVFIPTGSTTLDAKAFDTSQSHDLKDNSGLGFQFYGMFSLNDNIDMGLVLNYIPTVSYINDAEDNFELGSHTDINYRAAYRFKIPSITDLHLELHLEGGLSLFSYADNHGRAENGQKLYEPTKRFDIDNTSFAGWNAGGGLQVGYAVVPLMRIYLGLDYSLYAVQIFSGETSNPIPPILQGEDLLTVDTEGNRIKIIFGLEFSL